MNDICTPCEPKETRFIPREIPPICPPAPEPEPEVKALLTPKRTYIEHTVSCFIPTLQSTFQKFLDDIDPPSCC